jgi:hypothetical protein
MGLFIDPLKLKAAARSMQQFCPAVRNVFPGPVRDVVVEASTVFLYVLVCHQVFGKRFTRELRGFVAAYEQSLAQYATDKDHEFRERIRGLITVMFTEAGYPANDPQIVSDAFTPFETAMRAIKTHLTGIKQQNHFVLK